MQDAKAYSAELNGNTAVGINNVALEAMTISVLLRETLRRAGGEETKPGELKGDVLDALMSGLFMLSEKATLVFEISGALPIDAGLGSA